MGNTSFYTEPLDAQAVEQDAATTSEGQRLTSFYQDGLPLESGDTGSLIEQLEKAVSEAEQYRDEAKQYRDETQALYDAFVVLFTGFVTDLYMGAYTSQPDTGYYGGPLVAGVIYYDLNDKAAFMWNGTAWEPWATRIGPAGEVGPAGLPGV